MPKLSGAVSMSSSMDMHYNTSKKQANNLILKPGTDIVLNTKYLDNCTV